MNISIIGKYYWANGTTSYAVYSQCMWYRYELTRVWNWSGKRILFVMLNPSTATEKKNDQTLARCEKRARDLGFGAFRVCNLFAYRATKPTDMKKVSSPIGQLNDDYIRAGCDWADQIVCAWGNHGAHLRRGDYVTQLLRQTIRLQSHRIFLLKSQGSASKSRRENRRLSLEHNRPNLPILLPARMQKLLQCRRMPRNMIGLRSKQLYCLAKTGKGYPRHPIGTKSADRLLIW